MTWLNTQKAKKWILGIAIACNISILGYYKYRNFAIEQLTNIFGDDIGLPKLTALVIPIAMSFFTFQAISYLIDTFRGTTGKMSILDLALYLSFFPHLVAGPIVRPMEFVPQMNSEINPTKVEVIKAFSLITRGLFKKMIIADYLYTQIVRPVFANPAKASSIDTLSAVYAYSAQIYCDFSGYTDIAIGIALLLGFRFPQNFNKPYTATSIRDFWSRWHMTLSRWLKDYLYIPLGGNQKSFLGKRFVWLNLIITFLIGGLWHGSNITFVIWGLYHGLLLTAERPLRNFVHNKNIVIPKIVKRIITFHLVTFGWIIFNSESLNNAKILISRLSTNISFADTKLTVAIAVMIIIGIGFQYIKDSFTTRFLTALSAKPIVVQALAFAICLFFLGTFSDNVSAFLYGFF
jgi:alginate O-acetyltransferase complex protein AlgI